MKDLYFSLNLKGPVADTNVIRRAINDCLDVDTADTSSYVLLNPERKQFYDHHHRMLSTIGQLRARLALPKSYAWDALGNQDFDQETPSAFTDLTDILDELDLAGDLNAGAPAHHLPTRRYGSSIDAWQLIVAGGIAAGFCLVLILVSTLMSSSRELPENGRVLSEFETAANCQLQIKTRQNAGHNSIDVISKVDGRRILNVFVRDGQEATVDVPAGNYELKFSVGWQEDWDGKQFRRQLREFRPTEISVKPGSKCVFRIP